ncbi:hormone-sensitive lipase-like [Saccoglossus kowalevskii]|uniref:Hormone-sensitive lipase n=1 Tax=Saccoglossus kowalevskii TaxID=10224 RepID=A0ABM0GMJ3_SACKO|nr:PREDICTED: hormone-sensitive lipase-like [Saccoglossus kowalevskii]
MAATEQKNNQTTTKNAPFNIAGEFKTLRSLCIDNIEYFQRSKSQYKDRYFTAFCVIMQTADATEPLLEGFQRIVHHFDFDENTPGNGYRSLLHVVFCCIKKLIETAKYIKNGRSGLMFRSSVYCCEIEGYSNVFGQLKLLLGQAQKLLGGSKPGELFPDEELFPLMDEMLVEAESLYRECFYGRCLGFQYHESMLQPLQVVAVAMASFSESRKQHEGGFARFASTLMNSGKYMMDSALRADQIVKVTRNADIKFCKEFWSLTEGDIMQAVPNFMCPSVSVNKLIQIQPHCFEVPTADGDDTRMITPPCAHTGPGPSFIRLISCVQREGALMADTIHPPNEEPAPPPPNKKVAALSRSLLIHIHGGGFVAQSSKSHEVYLRSWAKELDIPIVSLDYSHAPEQPFPRAFEECFFAYAWIVRNAPALGSSGKHICLVGDSAGGNLAVAVAMRAANYGIRIPDGIVTFYAPFQVRYSPSPSRILSLMDPLLPLGVLSCCLASYAGMKEEMVPMSMPDYVNSPKSEPSTPRDAPEGAQSLTNDEAVAGPLSTDSSGIENNVDTKTPTSVSVSDLKVDEKDGSEMEEIPLSDDSPVQVVNSNNENDEKEKGKKPAPLYFNSPTQLYQNITVGPPYASSPIRKYRNIPIVNNPYISPLVADDDLLKGLPPMFIVACQLDPILDDSITFAKMLKRIGVPVKVKVVENLSHGFLNFSIVSKEAKRMSEECLKFIQEGLYGPTGKEHWEVLDAGVQTDPHELRAMYKAEQKREAEGRVAAAGQPPADQGIAAERPQTAGEEQPSSSQAPHGSVTEHQPENPRRQVRTSAAGTKYEQGTSTEVQKEIPASSVQTVAVQNVEARKEVLEEKVPEGPAQGDKKKTEEVVEMNTNVASSEDAKRVVPELVVSEVKDEEAAKEVETQEDATPEKQPENKTTPEVEQHTEATSEEQPEHKTTSEVEQHTEATSEEQPEHKTTSEVEQNTETTSEEQPERKTTSEVEQNTEATSEETFQDKPQHEETTDQPQETEKKTSTEDDVNNVAEEDKANNANPPEGLQRGEGEGEESDKEDQADN